MEIYVAFIIFHKEKKRKKKENGIPQHPSLSFDRLGVSPSSFSQQQQQHHQQMERSATQKKTGKGNEDQIDIQCNQSVINRNPVKLGKL